METQIQTIRSFQLTGKQLFNNFYSRSENIVVYSTMTMITLCISLMILKFPGDLMMIAFCCTYSFFTLFLLLRYLEKVDMKLLRDKYYINAENWTPDDFRHLQKREFAVRFDAFLVSNPNADIKEIYEEFSLLGSKSTGHIFNTFYILTAAILSAAGSVMYFLFSNAPFDVKWLVTQIFIVCAFILIYITAFAFLLLKQHLSTRIDRDKRIAEWIKERLPRK